MWTYNDSGVYSAISTNLGVKNVKFAAIASASMVC